MFKIYLDNCCYNRPYDGQGQPKIRLETSAKIFIQILIKQKAVKLYSSFVLLEEINANIDIEVKNSIIDFVNSYSTGYVAKDKLELIKEKVDKIMTMGIKPMDATHVACAILAECDYFISTDKRLLKCMTNEIKMVNPIDFIKVWKGNEYV